MVDCIPNFVLSANYCILTNFLCQEGNIKICDRAMKLDSIGNFVPLYFSLKWTFLLPLFPGAVVELENSVFLVISENYHTNYKHL